VSEWTPSAPIAALRHRAWLNRLIREFFHVRNVLEVETPILSAGGNTDPNIESLLLDWPAPAPQRRWLRTSPEYALKRLLAAGLGDCYELGRVFRAGEHGRRHNPEFTLLEWYRLGWDHHRLADEVLELVQGALGMVGRPEAAVERVSYRELFRREAGIDPFDGDADALAAVLAPYDVRADGLTRDDHLDLILTHVIEPRLAQRGGLTVVSDYPASQCALARVLPGEPPVAARFEVYLDGIELANGYHELADAAEQARRFEVDLAVRRTRGQALPAVDAHFLAALAHGLPDCAGVALGVDRLLMAMQGTTAIADVLAFPAARA
jgi:lysyl-tRNA synthetase class 2